MNLSGNFPAPLCGRPVLYCTIRILIFRYNTYIIRCRNLNLLVFQRRIGMWNTLQCHFTSLCSSVIKPFSSPPKWIIILPHPFSHPIPHLFSRLNSSSRSHPIRQLFFHPFIHCLLSSSMRFEFKFLGGVFVRSSTWPLALGRQAGRQAES
jgi:hypothetical protein